MLRVASIPLISHRGDSARNVALIAAWLREAARCEVGLVVFPEACIVGYGSFAKLARRELDALAEPLDGPSIRAVADTVERTGVAAGVGLIERAADGRLFNSYVMCMPGGLRYCHRKLHAFEHRRIDSGDQFTVFDTPWGVRIGILIGGDNYVIENTRMTALMGATLLVAPHRSYGFNRDGVCAMQPVSTEQWLRRDAGARIASAMADGDAMDWQRRGLPNQAAENGMFVVLSDGVDGGNEAASPGTGMIIDPSGRVLAESTSGADGIVSAELEPGLIGASAGRQWLAARRPDLYGPLAKTASVDALNFASRNVSARGAVALSFAQVSRGRMGG